MLICLYQCVLCKRIALANEVENNSQYALEEENSPTEAGDVYKSMIQLKSNKTITKQTSFTLMSFELHERLYN